MLHLGGDLVLVSWFEGVEASRFGILNTRDGSWKRGKGISGLVTDAVADPALDRAWLLCWYGLFEIELSTAKVTRKLRKGLGTYQRRLTPLAGATLGVSARLGKSMALVSTDSMELVGRMRVPAPDVTVELGASRLFMNFEVGTARHTDDRTPTGRAVAIPRAASAMTVGQDVAFLPSRETISDSDLHTVLAAPAAQREHTRAILSTLHPLGTIGWYDTTTMSVHSEGPDVGAERLLARSSDGHLFAASRMGQNYDRSLLVLDATGESVVERVSFPAGVADVIPLADAVLVWQGNPEQWPHLTVLSGLTGTTGTSSLLTAAAQPPELFRAPTRKPRELQLERQVLAAGESITNVTAERIALLGCRTEITEDPQARPVLRNLDLKRVRLRGSHVSGAIIEDVTIDGLDTDMMSGFIRGCEFRRVTLRGRVGYLGLFPEITKYPGHEREWEVHRALYEARLLDPEWMLDIRDAEGPIEIRGYPSRFFRLNPAIHAVVPFAKAVSMEWRDVDFGRSHFSVTLDDLVRLGREDATLIANPRGKHFADELRVIAELRERGIANA